MTADERSAIAEKLLALVFALRDEGLEGQAWIFATLTKATARAVLATIGPHGDADAILAVHDTQLRKEIDQAQRQYFAGKLAIPPRRVS